LLASLSDPTSLEVAEAFTPGLSVGSVTLPAAGYDYSVNWAISAGWTFTSWDIS
jgi:hypothetical protein